MICYSALTFLCFQSLKHFSIILHHKAVVKGFLTKNKVFHAFVGSFPWLDKSRDAIDKMIAWFEEQADIARERSWEKKPSDK